jgi:hypothetical protein
MANTYTLIASNTLSSSAASVTFSAIPGTYTDLVVRCSVRLAAGAGSTIQDLLVRFNATTTNYSITQLTSDGSAASSGRISNTTRMLITNVVSGDNATNNTFGSVEIYIPSYTVSQNKPIANFGASENNSTTAGISAVAGLWRDTTAISSIELYNGVGNLASGSSFFLYGIKNS